MREGFKNPIPEEAVAETSVRPSKLALGKGRITAT